MQKNLGLTIEWNNTYLIFPDHYEPPQSGTPCIVKAIFVLPNPENGFLWFEKKCTPPVLAGLPTCSTPWCKRNTVFPSTMDIEAHRNLNRKEKACSNVKAEDVFGLFIAVSKITDNLLT